MYFVDLRCLIECTKLRGNNRGFPCDIVLICDSVIYLNSKKKTWLKFTSDGPSYLYLCPCVHDNQAALCYESCPNAIPPTPMRLNPYKTKEGDA